VSRKASDETGLEKDTPVVLGGPDTQCGLLGLGVYEKGQLGILAGWSAPLQMVTEQPIFDAKARTWTGLHVIPGKWVLESSVTEAGHAFNWMEGLTGPVHQESSSPVSPEEDSPGKDEVVALLGPRVMDASSLGLQLGGILFPVPISWSAPSKGHLRRAALENLGFAIKGNYNQLQEVSGSPIEEVGLSGGLTHVPGFAQMIADLLEREVRLPEMRDVSLLGTAICAAVGTGFYKEMAEAMEAMKGRSQVLEPDPLHSSELEERYKRWSYLYEKLADLEGSLP